MFKHTNKVILGVDIGGSHISSALVKPGDAASILDNSFIRKKIHSSGSAEIILSEWVDAIHTSLENLNGYILEGIGIAMPGPFNYREGISLIKGVNKYNALYGLNIKEALRNQLNIEYNLPVIFENDACCFGLGECISGEAKGFKKVIAITLGTGLGACFIKENQVLHNADGIPEGGYLYNYPFKKGIAEDYISSRWVMETFESITGESITVKEISVRAEKYNDKQAKNVFLKLAENIAELLAPFIQSFEADCLVIGGRIAQSSNLFLPSLNKLIKDKFGISIPIKISDKMELSAIAGAAGLFQNVDKENMKKINKTISRKSSQELLPTNVEEIEQKDDAYNLYPFYSLGAGKIFSGYESLSKWMIYHKLIMIDGFQGNDWSVIRENLAKCFKKIQKKVLWFETSAFLKDETEIEKLVSPYLGDRDSVWGTKTELRLEDFYHIEDLKNLESKVNGYDLIILIGTGAGLCNWHAPVIYVDLPKNEVQYRLRAGSGNNIGASKNADWPSIYKRLYFIDWVVLKEHRKEIKKKIAVVADAQWKDKINWAFKSSVEEGLELLSHSIIRVRPWFEAGAWGGQWLKEHIPALNKNEINYAWSFELITPENGLVFESDGNLLEISFDWLMENNSKEVLGKDSERFGDEFPIRFDFLDTFEGGNLSIQCHPSLSYIQKNFGEKITQDETYYILDCKKDAGVYLGFREDINPSEFRNALEESVEKNEPIDIEEYVQWHPSHKHDFFLIPNQTIHSSGVNNLVLEISATPYIFTFKMYDWVRPDLQGNPRPINIKHAFNNLDFERKGSRVKEELISSPVVIEENDNYRLIHLPTHKEHFYDVHRIEFVHEATIKTNNSCHVLMLVEGESIIVKTIDGTEKRFNYAETFIIPAAAESYQLINESGKMVKVIKAFIK
ncbi:MAG TPA: ROK family protein [Hanamia sp.]|nr:ROK family protein [Hanamia sp.]